MVSPRNRERPALEERLLKFAEEARTAATLVAPSREQDELLTEGSHGGNAGKARPTGWPWQVLINSAGD